MPVRTIHEHNDYVLIIKEYLLHYAAFMQYIHDTEMRIQDIDYILAEEPAPRVPALSGAGGCGGGDGTSPQEQDYFRHEQLKEEQKRLKRNLKDVKTRMDRLTRCLHELDDTDRRILENYYIDGVKSWEWTAKIINASTSFCFKHGKDALQELANRYFGLRAMPVQTRFVFIE